MKIGLPKALLYYRYGHLWEIFFRKLGCDILISEDTREDTLLSGTKSAVDENCLPLKIFLGHVQTLIGRCDYILVPRFAKTGRNDQYCVRFWGLPDLVQSTFPGVSLLSYNMDSGRWGAESMEFIKMGLSLRKSPLHSLPAYHAGLRAQQLYDQQAAKEQHARLALPGPKILIASQAYLIRDPYVGNVILQLLRAQGVAPLLSDCCNRAKCRALSKELSDGLYWSLNKEMAGAILLHKHHVDGILLLTAFPCGSDSLVNELILRKIKDVPIIQILLDEHQARAGLETRIESFVDILRQRRDSLAQA